MVAGGCSTVFSLVTTQLNISLLFDVGSSFKDFFFINNILMIVRMQFFNEI